MSDIEDKNAGSSRRFPRITLAAQVRMEFEDIWDLAENETLNLSRRGLFVKTSSPRAVGTTLRFEIKVQGKAFTVEGQVIHHNAERGQKGMGIKLTSVGDGWDEFVETLEARKRDLADSVDVDLG